jgi:hypothetical protein
MEIEYPGCPGDPFIQDQFTAFVPGNCQAKDHFLGGHLQINPFIGVLSRTYRS